MSNGKVSTLSGEDGSMEMGNADAPTCIEEIEREVKRSRKGTGILSASEAHRNHLHTPSHDHHFPCAIISYRNGVLFSTKHDRADKS